MSTPPEGVRRRRPVVVVVGGIVLMLVFLMLAGWQVERRAWKLDLIARVDARVHAAPGAPLAPDGWAALDPAQEEYRHVALAGAFAPGRDALTKAVTVLGPGSWVLSGFRTQAGFMVLVNRGFVASGTIPAPPPSSPLSVTGLVRLSEPGGGFLRTNDPANERWYSRDVAAIAAARGWTDVAPYFVDADASPGGGAVPGQPVGGLTVVTFRNEHLVYALTWLALALMTGAGTLYATLGAARLRALVRRRG